MTMPAIDNDDDDNTQMLRGLVQFFNPIKGFGFIERDDNSQDMFVHISNFAEKTGDDFNPEGARVEFEIGQNKRTGQPCAVNVRFVE